MANEKSANVPKPKCGIIMPISASDGYTAAHWQDVLQVIQDAADSVGFEANLVSANGKADIIHATIINNIFHNEIVICDVSDMNPNVMIELGLRFAAKKPVIIIFDTDKKYPFDIGQLRYYEYGKELRYSSLVKFKRELAEIIQTIYTEDLEGRYKPYLSHFTEVTVNPATVPTEQVSIVEALEKLRREVIEIKSNQIIIDTDRIVPHNLHRHIAVNGPVRFYGGGNAVDTSESFSSSLVQNVVEAILIEIRSDSDFVNNLVNKNRSERAFFIRNYIDLKYLEVDNPFKRYQRDHFRELPVSRKEDIVASVLEKLNLPPSSN